MKLKFIPNLLTLLRIVIIPFFIYFFVKENSSVCAILFLVSGVSDADVSHERGNAIVTHDASVTADTLKDAVTAAGYKVLD